MFSVIKNDKQPSFLDIYKKYVSLRPSNTKSCFFGIQKWILHRTSCLKKNVLMKFQKKVATYLKLPNPELYIYIIILYIGKKQLGGWASTAVAKQYVEDSVSISIKEN